MSNSLAISFFISASLAQIPSFSRLSNIVCLILSCSIGFSRDSSTVFASGLVSYFVAFLAALIIAGLYPLLSLAMKAPLPILGTTLFGASGALYASIFEIVSLSAREVVFVSFLSTDVYTFSTALVTSLICLSSVVSFSPPSLTFSTTTVLPSPSVYLTTFSTTVD